VNFSRENIVDVVIEGKGSDLARAVKVVVDVLGALDH
jgi:hypothetical protein